MAQRLSFDERARIEAMQRAGATPAPLRVCIDFSEQSTRPWTSTRIRDQVGGLPLVCAPVTPGTATSGSAERDRSRLDGLYHLHDWPPGYIRVC